MDTEKKCVICGREAVFYSEYLKQDLCKKHFERMLIKRVKSNMNSYKIKNQNFKLGSENKCGKEFLKFVFRGMESENGKELCSYTLEDFAISVMSFFLFHEPSNKKIEGNEKFDPLFNVSEKEIISFFRLKKIKLNEIKRNKKEETVLSFLRDIEERRPGGMISLVKAGINLGII
jgi:hypothetical protein